MDETDKMNRMVMKLLSLNHLEDGSDVLEMTRFDLTPLVRGVIDSSKLLAQKMRLQLSLTAPIPYM